MSDPGAWSSTDSDVLAAWGEAMERWSAYTDRVRSFQGEFPGFACLERSWSTGRWIVGLRHREDGVDDPPGPGWRFNKTTGGWVPDKRTKAGKALATRFHDDLQVQRLGPLPGMPDKIFIPNRSYTPGAFEHDGTVYVYWDAEPAERLPRVKGFDATKWETVPLSVYYAAREALDATKAGS